MTLPRGPLSGRRRAIAWAVAIAVDLVQMPTELTGPLGWLMGVGLDLVTMGVMWALLGFHWAFLPSVVAEAVPLLNLAPTWTLAVALATRERKHQGNLTA